MSKYLSGMYKPSNPKKFIGDVKNIVYRSSWELSYLRQLDRDSNVLQVGSEEIIIPYYDMNGKIHRYFVDFFVRRKVGEEIITELIEIKPYKETIPPVITEGSRTKTNIRKVLTWDINCRKWEAARKYCEKKGWQFRIVTENELPGAKR